MSRATDRSFPYQVRQAIRDGEDFRPLISHVAGEDLHALAWMLLGAEIVTGAQDKRVSHAYDLTQARMMELDAHDHEGPDGPEQPPHVRREYAARGPRTCCGAELLTNMNRWPPHLKTRRRFTNACGRPWKFASDRPVTIRS